MKSHLLSSIVRCLILAGFLLGTGLTFISSASAAGTCVGSCGKQAPAGCWCDSKCKTNGNCCSDYAIACVPNYKVWQDTKTGVWGNAELGAEYSVNNWISAANYGYGKLTNDNVTAMQKGSASVKVFGTKINLVDVSLSRQRYASSTGLKDSIKTQVKVGGINKPTDSTFIHTKTIPLVNIWSKSKSYTVLGHKFSVTVKVGGNLVATNTGATGNVFNSSAFESAIDLGLSASPSMTVNLGATASAYVTACPIPPLVCASAGATGDVNLIELSTPAGLKVVLDRNSTGTYKKANYTATASLCIKKLAGKLTAWLKLNGTTLWSTVLGEGSASKQCSSAWTTNPGSGSVDLNNINSVTPINSP